MTAATERRRDRRGRFIRICRDCELSGQTREARWYIDGYGFYGLYGTSGRAVFCKRHADRACARLINAGARRGFGSTYRVRRADA